MKLKLFILLLALVILFFTLRPCEASMYSLINSRRKTANLPALTINSKLEKSAKTKACDIRDKKYWSHVDPQGRSAWYLFLKYGYEYLQAGENLARDFKNDKEAMLALMASPTHKANILDPEFQDVGVGYCGAIIVQHYGLQR